MNVMNKTLVNSVDVVIELWTASFTIIQEFWT